MAGSQYSMSSSIRASQSLRRSSSISAASWKRNFATLASSAGIAAGRLVLVAMADYSLLNSFLRRCHCPVPLTIDGPQRHLRRGQLLVGDAPLAGGRVGDLILEATAVAHPLIAAGQRAAVESFELLPVIRRTEAGGAVELVVVVPALLVDLVRHALEAHQVDVQLRLIDSKRDYVADLHVNEDDVREDEDRRHGVAAQPVVLPVCAGAIEAAPGVVAVAQVQHHGTLA